jgi:response regulator RpfG family c-di-GMP phosphodiesterase
MMALSTDETPDIPARSGQTTAAKARTDREKAPRQQGGKSPVRRFLPPIAGLLLGAVLAFTLAEIWPDFFRQSRQAVAGLPPGLLLLLLLPAGGFLALLILRGRGRGHAALAALQQRLAKETRDKEELAQILANFPDPVVLCDSQGRIAAASRAALRGDVENLEALRGQGLSVLYGEDSARTLKKINEEVLATGQAKSSLFRISRRGETRYCRREHRRLRMPAAGKADEADSILLVERDVTTEIQEGDRRRRGQRAFIELLLDVVDQNDPLAAQTGRRIGDLAARLAEDLELSGSERRTAQNAGYLLALVDARVPRSVLRGDLPGRPVDYVCLAREEVADLVAQLELEGDLAECLRQLDERMDGRGGPRGLKAPQILPAARVLKVADGYLRRLMIQGEGLAAQDRALSEMLKEADQAYDGDTVDSLVCLISRDLEAGMVDGFDDISRDQSH